MIHDINELLPQVRLRAHAFLDHARIAGYAMIITETYRSPERQAELYAQGRTAPGQIVTHAKPGQSKHETRRAFDVCFPGDQPYSDKHPWHLLGVWAKAAGLEWGGNWTKPDRPHLQYTGPADTGDEPMFPKPNSATPTETRPTLRQGDWGPSVAKMIQALMRAGGMPPRYAGDYFGAEQTAAVKLFQAAHGLTADGVVGPLTWRALDPTPDDYTRDPAADLAILALAARIRAGREKGAQGK